MVGLFVGVGRGLGAEEESAPEADHRDAQRIRITHIDILGLNRIAETTVRGALSLREGSDFSIESIRDDIHAIYGLGYFEDVRAATEEFEGGLRLIFSVTEWPIVREIRYEGYDKIELDKLKEQVTISPGRFLDLRMLTQARERLATYCHDQGYFQATILPLVQENPAGPGEVTLTFIVREGKRARVRAVEFTGNKAFSDRKLRGVVDTSSYFWLSSWLTDSGLYQKEAAVSDVDRLRDQYLNEGYLEVQVGAPEVTLSDDQRWFRLVFPIVEGDQFTISGVSFSGVELFSEEHARGVITTTTGELFRKREIQSDILVLTDLYGERGYAFASVVPQVFPEPGTQRVRIRYDVQEGQQVHVQRIDISGNVKTRDKVIRRELRLHEREILDTQALRRSFQRLNNLDYFENIEIAPVRIQPDLVDLDVKVKEKPTGTFSVGGGYSSVDKLIGLVEVTQNNLFGRGQYLQLQGQLGGRSSSYSLTFRDPFFLDYPVSASISVFNRDRDFDSYKEQRRGASLVFGKNFTEYVSGSMGYSFQVLDISNVSETAPTFINDQVGKSTTSSLRWTLQHDTRDVYLAPTKGARHAMTVDYAGTFLGGDNDFYRVLVDSTFFHPVWWDTVVSVRGRFGFAHPTTVDGTLPVGERFFVGGINTVRGFDFGEAGPVVNGEVIGGNKELIFNTEYIVPIVPEANIRGVIFFDAGRSWDFGESVRFSELRLSVGAGIRLFLPIGPIRVEYGYNLNPREGEKGYAVDFTIGAPF